MPQGHLVQGNSERVRKLTPSHLFRAILKNDVSGVIELVEMAPSLLFQKDKKGWCAVHYAARVGSVEIMEVLRDHGAATRVEDLKGMTPLAIATYHKHDTLVRYLLRKQLAAESIYEEAAGVANKSAGANRTGHTDGTNAGRHDSVGDNGAPEPRMTKGTIQRSLLTAAANAIRQDDLDCLIYLSEKAKITKKAELDAAPLCLVAVAADAEGCLSWLLQPMEGLTGPVSGGTLTKKRIWGQSSLLHLAAKFGSCRCAQVLLRQPCPAVRAQDDAGYTPLMYALALTKSDMLSLLVRYDPKTLDILSSVNHTAASALPPGGRSPLGRCASLGSELFSTKVMKAVKESTPETRRFLKAHYHIDLEPVAGSIT